MKLLAARWFFSLPASMFYCLVTSLLHATVGSPAGLPAAAALLATWFLHSSVTLWTIADARARQRSVPYDLGSFVFFTWPVFVPVYLFSTRGWKAVAPIGCFILIYLAAAGVALVPFVMDPMRR